MSANPLRAVHAPFYLADEQLEHYAALYLALPQAWRRAHAFEQFLSRVPQLRALAAGPVRAPWVALTSKEQSALRKALGRAISVIGNGRHIEKLRHRRYPRHASRRLLPKGPP